MYRTEALNKVANALSRKLEEREEEEKELRLISRPFWQEFQEVLEEVEMDMAPQKIKKELLEDLNSRPAYTMENNRLHYKGRLVL